jgi:regulator of replication initiation timing
MAILDTVKTIAELAKKGMTVELQEKIVELREEVMALKEENIRLRDENLKLKQELDLYTKGDICPRCKKPTWKLESSKPHETFGNLGVIARVYKCSDCGLTEEYTITPDGKSNLPDQSRRR